MGFVYIFLYFVVVDNAITLFNCFSVISVVSMISEYLPGHFFKHFQGYLWIFRDNDAYSFTLRHYSFCKTLHLKCLTVF